MLQTVFYWTEYLEGAAVTYFSTFCFFKNSVASVTGLGEVTLLLVYDARGFSKVQKTLGDCMGMVFSEKLHAIKHTIP